MPSFYLQTPATRSPEWAHVSSLLYTQHDPEGEFIWDVTEGQAIDVAREIIVKKYFEYPGKPEFLLMADSDATWAPAAAQRLMSRNLPVVTGVIFKRDIPPVPTMGLYVGQDVEGNHMYNFGPTIKAILNRTDGLVKEDTENHLVLPERDDDLMEIDGSGCHFMMIRRDVLEKMKPPLFRAVVSSGEDFDFCRKVQAAGFKIYADLSVYTGHIIGPKITFGLREFLAFYKYTDLLKEAEQVWKMKR